MQNKFSNQEPPLFHIHPDPEPRSLETLRQVREQLLQAEQREKEEEQSRRNPAWSIKIYPF